ncbi:MAG: PadR family transcriptional regulator [Beutenbergiaceae bacterium]
MLIEVHDPQLLKGVLPILVLGLLQTAESYGYELVTRLRQSGLAGISTGTVYPVLSRLERDGSLAARLQPSSSGPARKYYRPTEAGRQRYHSSMTAWMQLSLVVTTVDTEREETR